MHTNLQNLDNDFQRLVNSNAEGIIETKDVYAASQGEADACHQDCEPTHIRLWTMLWPWHHIL